MRNIGHLFILLTSIFLSVEIVAQNSPTPLKLIEFVLTPDAKDWNYKVNENASIQVSVL